MNRMEKIVSRMRASKQAMLLRHIEYVLMHYGFIKERQRGSHCHYVNQLNVRITIPAHRNQVESVYLRRILKPLGL